MSLSKRRDFGVRVAGDKGRYPDEFVTKQQIVQGQNITITHLGNFDIMISANVGGGGGGIGNNLQGDGYEKIRDLYVELKLVRPFINTKSHFDINDSASPSQNMGKFFGTHVFAEIRHNWNLTKPDMFQYSVLDSRYLVGPNSKNHVNSIPRVVGVNGNKIRIIGTDADLGTRFNPYYWVDLKDDNSEMQDTRLLHFKPINHASNAGENSGDHTVVVPTYRIRITEVRDYEFNRLAANDGYTYLHDTTYGA